MREASGKRRAGTCSEPESIGGKTASLAVASEGSSADGLRTQVLATFGPTTFDHSASGLGGHAGPEAVAALPADLTGLIRTFHGIAPVVFREPSGSVRTEKRGVSKTGKDTGLERGVSIRGQEPSYLSYL